MGGTGFIITIILAFPLCAMKVPDECLKDQKLGIINANYADQSMLKVFPTVSVL